MKSKSEMHFLYILVKTFTVSLTIVYLFFLATYVPNQFPIMIMMVIFMVMMKIIKNTYQYQDFRVKNIDFRDG